MSDSTTGTIPNAISNEELRQMLQTIFGRLPDPDLTRENTALMIVDMQYVDAHPDYGAGSTSEGVGLRPSPRLLLEQNGGVGRPQYPTAYWRPPGETALRCSIFGSLPRLKTAVTAR